MKVKLILFVFLFIRPTFALDWDLEELQKSGSETLQDMNYLYEDITDRPTPKDIRQGITEYISVNKSKSPKAIKTTGELRKELLSLDPTALRNETIEEDKNEERKNSWIINDDICRIEPPTEKHPLSAKTEKNENHKTYKKMAKTLDWKQEKNLLAIHYGNYLASTKADSFNETLAFLIDRYMNNPQERDAISTIFLALMSNPVIAQDTLLKNNKKRQAINLIDSVGQGILFLVGLRTGKALWKQRKAFKTKAKEIIKEVPATWKGLSAKNKLFWAGHWARKNLGGPKKEAILVLGGSLAHGAWKPLNYLLFETKINPDKLLKIFQAQIIHQYAVNAYSLKQELIKLKKTGLKLKKKRKGHILKEVTKSFSELRHFIKRAPSFYGPADLPTKKNLLLLKKAHKASGKGEIRRIEEYAPQDHQYQSTSIRLILSDYREVLDLLEDNETH